jgi:hypothetical protein
VHVRVGIAKRGKQMLGRRGARGQFAVREIEVGCSMLRGPPGIVDGAGGAVERAPRLHQKRVTGLGELDAARQALKQRNANVVLEIPNLLRKGGLRDAEATGGPHEGAFLRDGDEVAKVAQFHESFQDLCV